jgi:hypothetical protein
MVDPQRRSRKIVSSMVAPQTPPGGGVAEGGGLPNLLALFAPIALHAISSRKSGTL